MQFVPIAFLSRFLILCTLSASATFPVQHGELYAEASSPGSEWYWDTESQSDVSKPFTFSAGFVLPEYRMFSVNDGYADIATKVVGGHWTLNDKWSLQASYVGLDIGTLNRQQVEVSSVRATYAVTPRWQVGTGVQHTHVINWANDDNPVFWEVNNPVASSNDTAPVVFTRYLMPGSAPGEAWQLGMTYAHGSIQRILESTVMYQPAPDWSWGASYKTVNNLQSQETSDVLKMTFGHSFTDSASVQLIFESNLTEGGAPSANLFGSWVF